MTDLPRPSEQTPPPRTGALLWALGRVAVGTAALAFPGRLTALWVGPSLPPPAAHVLGRALGGRDLVLGCGAWWALRTHSPAARPWLVAGGAADAVDAAATLLVRSGLPPARSRLVVAAAAASALSAAALDRTLRAPRTAGTAPGHGERDPAGATGRRDEPG